MKRAAMNQVCVLPENHGKDATDWSVADLCAVIWETERRFGLIDWTVSGVKPWLAGRFSVYKQLASSLGIFEGTGREPSSPWLTRLRVHMPDSFPGR